MIPPPPCESNTLVRATAGVVSAPFGSVSYFALHATLNIPCSMDAFCLPGMWALKTTVKPCPILPPSPLVRTTVPGGGGG